MFSCSGVSSALWMAASDSADGACDLEAKSGLRNTAEASAQFVAGELRVTFPRVKDRRSRPIDIPIRQGA